MNRPDLKGLNKAQKEYVEHLEAQINGSSKLMCSLNLASDAIAIEIDKITTEGNILDDDKKFSKVLALIEKSNKIKGLTHKELKEDTEDTTPESEETKSEPFEDNAFESVSQRIKEKLNGKKA